MASAAKQVSESEREARREIAKKASAHYPGAAVSQPQLDAVIPTVRRTMRNGICKTLGCTERQLASYADGDITVAELNDKTREKLSGFNAVYSKPWARKTASMLLELHKARKRASRRTAKATAENSVVTESA